MKRDPFPAHIAIIMDGNSRWARMRGLDAIWGHRAGADRVSEIAETCGNGGARYLSLYAFSSENWKRPENEVNSIMSLLAEFLRDRMEEIKSNNIRLLTAGRRDRFGEEINRLLDRSIGETSVNTGLTVILCLDYGGRREITDAASRFRGKSAEDFSKNLYVPEASEIDLLIRTSGEERMSNFMLWQTYYSELYFTDVLWPDFGGSELIKAVRIYNRRQRRFGERK